MDDRDVSRLIEAFESRNREYGKFDFSKSFDEIVQEIEELLATRDENIQKMYAKMNDIIKKAGGKKWTNDAEKKQIEAIKKSIDVEIGKALRSGKNKEEAIEAANKKINKKALEKIVGSLGYRIEKSAESQKELGIALKEYGKTTKNKKIGKLATSIGEKLEEQSKYLGDNNGKLAFWGNAIKYGADAIIKGLNFATKMLRYDAQGSQIGYTYSSAMLDIRGQKANAELQMQAELFQKKADAELNYLSATAKANFKYYNGSLETTISSFSDITGSAYKALDTTIDYKYDLERAQLEKKFAIGDAAFDGEKWVGGEGSLFGILAQKAGVKLDESMKVFGQQGNVNEATRLRGQTKLENEKMADIVGGAVGLVGGAVGLLGGPVMAGITGAAAKGISDAVFGYVTANKDLSLQINEQSQSYLLKGFQLHKDFVTTSTDAIATVSQSGLEKIKDISNELLTQLQNEEKAWAALTSDTDKKWEKFQDLANNLGKSFGYVGEGLETFEKRLFETQKVVAKYGKNMEDIQKMQDNYATATGRNKELSNADYESAFAMGTFWGDDVVSSLDSGMEIFNLSVNDSNKKFHEINKSVTKMGLNGKKFGKDLVNNLKLAEKYQFKNGVDGLMKMSMWAQNMRFNVDSLDGMLNNIQENGLEGVIKQSAELQVLGGNFAMGSDPLAMANEAFTNPEAFAKRMNRMIAGQGYLDKSGNAVFGAASQMIMRSFAKSSGQDYKDVLNQARTQLKINAIQKSLNPNASFNDEQMAMIANKASFNSGTQQWEANINGVTKAVGQITPDDLKALVDNSNKSLEEIALDNLSMSQAQTAAQTQIQANLMKNYEDFKENHLKRISNVFEHYFNNPEEYRKNIDKYLTEATNAQKSLLNYYYTTKPEEIAKTAIENLHGAVTSISGILQGIADKIGAKYNITGEDLEKVGDNQHLLKALTQMQADGGIEAALSKLENDKSAWYTDTELVDAMVSLRQNPTVINGIKDKETKKNLAKIIYRWDDPGWFHDTQDLDLKNNKALTAFFDNISKEVDGENAIRDYHTGATHFSPHGGVKNINGAAFHRDVKTATNYYGGDYTTDSSEDGFMSQNGSLVKIHNKDQVLAAKNGGPIDRMLHMVQSVLPRPMSYDSVVKDKPSNGGNSGLANNQIEVSPIQIQINGSLQLNGDGGSIDMMQQISNDPNLLRSLAQLISVEVEKKVNGGRVINPLNRNLSWT